MQIKTFFNATVALALLVVGAHAKVPSGTYTIVNQNPSSHFSLRAITFNGEGQTVTVSSDDPASSKQKWIVKDFDDKTQTTSPAGEEGDGLQCAWGNNVITVLPANKYVWTITQNQDKATYTIQDGGETVYWGLGSRNSNTDVTIGKKTATGEQSWFFFPAVDV